MARLMKIPEQLQIFATVDHIWAAVFVAGAASYDECEGTTAVSGLET
jgi:hypothetical protein